MKSDEQSKVNADDATVANTVTDRVCEVVKRLTTEGRKVIQTGPNGLYELLPSELKGLSRDAVRKSIKNLIQLGQICVGDDKILRIKE